METGLLIGMPVFLFLVLPLAVGFGVKHLWPACTLWLVVAGVLTFSQSNANELGGLWVVVLAVSLLVMPLVFAGTKLRSRLDSRSSSHR